MYKCCTKFATFAYKPLNCPAGSSADATEMTFYVGGMFAQDRWNDTTSAVGSADAAAVQFVHVAALIAAVLSMGCDVAIGIIDSRKHTIFNILL